MTEDLSDTFGEPATSRLRGLLPRRRDALGNGAAIHDGADDDLATPAGAPMTARRGPWTTATAATNRRWGTVRMAAREHVDLLVLCALRGGPASGHGIAERLRADSGGTLAPPERTVHATLHRLARNRLLRRTGSGPGVGPHYALTDAGQRVLRARIREWRALARAVDRVVASEPTS